MNNHALSVSRSRRELTDKIVQECREKATQMVADWEPANPEWPIIDGCAYLRLSTDEQVAVEKGSLEQQIYIAVSEADSRSKSDRVNYRISKFFIEPGITGTTDKRPEFQSLLSDIKALKYRFIVMKELARVTREVNVWKDFFNLCIKSDCQIFIRNFPLNPNDPAQIFQLDILAAFAQYESNQTSRRVRESVYSAMITSGKFNSTHRVLGLKQQIVNGEPQVGFYVPDTAELKTVTWIMETFVKYASYSKTIEECDRHGVVNWNGNSLKTHALVNLLSNKRYIGRWELNVENKDKDQSKLMPYDRYAEIELPHGCLLDIGLWQRVQATIESVRGRRDKNTKINRVYPLSGLLRFKDGSNFAGESAWKGDYRHTYYFNRENDVRLVAETIEEEAQRVTSEIVRKTPTILNAIAKFGKECIAASDIHFTQVSKLKSELESLEKDKKALDRRLDFLLEEGTTEGAQAFRLEYKTEVERLNKAMKSKRHQIEQVSAKAEALKNEEFNWKEVGKNCEAALAAVQEKDPVALKTAFRHLFEAIVVGDIGTDGKTELKFVLKGQNVLDFLDSVNRRKKIRDGTKMAQEEGLEPPTKRLTAACSTS